MSMTQQIIDKITEALQPVHLEVLNESPNHHVPDNAETHFKLIVVSAQFDGVSRVRRHQRIYDLLADELAQSVHALSLHSYTPGEWDARGGAVTASPDCRGGHGQ